jgi:hypothetical protein
MYIMQEQPNGKLRAIYGLSDDYSSEIELMLLEHYTERESVASLIAMGDIDYIPPETIGAKPRLETFYYRDWDDEIYFNSISEAIHKFRGSGHPKLYAWIDGKWFYTSNTHAPLAPLTKIDSNKNS